MLHADCHAVYIKLKQHYNFISYFIISLIQHSQHDVCWLPLHSIARVWCMLIAMLSTSNYNSIITQYSTVMLSTSNNKIIISLLPCCLLYFCLYKDKILIKLYTMLNIKLSVSWICILILNKFTYALPTMTPSTNFDIISISEYVNFILDNELSTTILLPLDFSTLLLSHNLFIKIIQ